MLSLELTKNLKTKQLQIELIIQKINLKLYILKLYKRNRGNKKKKRMEDIEEYADLTRRSLFSLYLPDLGKMAPQALLNENMLCSQTNRMYPAVSDFHEYASRQELNLNVNDFMRSLRKGKRFASNPRSRERIDRFLANTDLDFFATKNPQTAELHGYAQTCLCARITHQTEIFQMWPRPHNGLISQWGDPDFERIRSVVKNVKTLAEASDFIDTYGMWLPWSARFKCTTVTIAGCQVYSNEFSLVEMQSSARTFMQKMVYHISFF
jgi:hypothetical protein